MHFSPRSALPCGVRPALQRTLGPAVSPLRRHILREAYPMSKISRIELKRFSTILGGLSKLRSCPRVALERFGNASLSFQLKIHT